MRIVKIVAGLMLLACGVAMLALPGPGWLTIAAALTLLSTELRWARRALDALKGVVTRLAGRRRKKGTVMAKTLWTRLVRGVHNVIVERDRAELRAMDTLLATVEKSRRRGKRTKRAARRHA